MTGRISMSARRELVAAVAERYRAAERGEKGPILNELTAVTGWHRKHAVREREGKRRKAEAAPSADLRRGHSRCADCVVGSF
jgi:hypothetical protein